MSIWKNGKLVAGGRQATPLLSFMWADHILDDISWLRADTFSWQSGAVYQAVYQHLANDIDGKTLQSETVGGTTIQFYLADDGHKICPESEMSNVAAIYATTGVAWYYILDTVNERFKLPRTKFGFTGLRDNVGNYVDAGLPNITGSAIVCGQNDKAIKVKSYTGAFKEVGTGSVYNNYDSSSQTTTYGIALDASDASSVYGASTTVQPRATQMYLYFYVGEFTQTAIENTAGLNAELFNDKVDIGHQVIAFQAPTTANNYTWYRKYADGWVEQGGITDGTVDYSSNPISLPITMADTNYLLVAISNRADKSAYVQSKTTTGFCVKDRVMADIWYDSNFSGSWEVKGMAA